MSEATQVPFSADTPQLVVNADFQEHSWVQKGRDIECGGGCSMVHNTAISNHGTRLPAGVMLKGSKGNWELVYEQGDVRDYKNYTLARRAAEKERQRLESLEKA